MYNITKQRQQLRLILQYVQHQKKILRQIVPQKKDINFGFMLQNLVMLEPLVM
jgi:hypothetical protein